MFELNTETTRQAEQIVATVSAGYNWSTVDRSQH